MRPRAIIALAAAATLALGAIVVASSAPGAAVIDADVRAQIGPIPVEEDGRVVFAATNVGDTSRRVNLRLYDQDGEPLGTREVGVPRGTTRVLALNVSTSDIDAVRGRLLANGAFRDWRASLSLIDGTSNTILFWEHLIDLSRAFDERATTALFRVGPDNPVILIAGTFGNQAPGYYGFRVRFLNREGEVVASQQLSSVAPGETATATFDPADPVAVRAEVVPLDGGRYLASGFLSAPTSGFLSVEFQETHF